MAVGPIREHGQMHHRWDTTRQRPVLLRPAECPKYQHPLAATVVGMANTEKPHKIRWYYRLPGKSVRGPTTAEYATEKEARQEIRRLCGLKQLPQGTEIWRAYF